MKSPITERQSSNRTSFSPSETSRARNGLDLVELLMQSAPYKPPNISGYCQVHPQTDGKILLLKTTLIYLTEQRKVELVYN